MNPQPETLRLADLLDFAVQTYYEPGGYLREEDQLMAYAAAELRRLHEIEKLFLAYKLEQEAAKEQT